MGWNRRRKREKGPVLDKIRISSKIRKINYDIRVSGFEVQDFNHLKLEAFDSIAEFLSSEGIRPFVA